MGRILFWVILIVAIYAAFVFARSRRTKGDSHKQVDGKKSKFPTAMIECPECGAYFPEDEAVLGDGAGIMSITALAVAMLSMLLFMQIEKKKKIAWLQSMAMPLAMFIGMGAVMLLAKVLPTHIAWLEWRG